MMTQTVVVTRGKIVQTLFVFGVIIFWALVSEIVVFLIAMSHLREYQLLSSLDQVTTGEYVDADVIAHEGRSTENEITEYVLVYEYEVDGESYLGRVTTSFTEYVDFVPGGNVSVRYPSDDPAFSVANKSPSIANFVGAAVFFVIWTGIVIAVSLNYVQGSESLKAVVNQWKGKPT
jgi:hypothetical protein